MFLGSRSILISYQLNEVTASLDLKSTAISELETQIEELKASLDRITADLEAARQNAEVAELAKATTDKDLAETKAALATSQADRDKLQQGLGEVRAHLQPIVQLTSIAGRKDDGCGAGCPHRNSARAD